jgi:hypothetical protein
MQGQLSGVESETAAVAFIFDFCVRLLVNEPSLAGL